MTFPCMRCAGADGVCGRLAWLVNFTAAAPVAPVDRSAETRHAEPDEYFIHHPVEGRREMAKRAIEPGRRYREIRRSVFSGDAGAEWIVEGVKADLLGLMHARLVSAADLTRQKTLSVRTLADPTRFEEV